MKGTNTVITPNISEVSAPDVGVWLTSDHVLPFNGPGAYALRASRCTQCGQAVFPASSICPFCLAEGGETLPLRGGATLYSFTRLHMGPKRWAAPYAVGYADFPNGLRLFAKLSGADGTGEPWRINQPVELVVEREAPSGETPERFRYYFDKARP